MTYIWIIFFIRQQSSDYSVKSRPVQKIHLFARIDGKLVLESWMTAGMLSDRTSFAVLAQVDSFACLVRGGASVPSAYDSASTGRATDTQMKNRLWVCILVHSRSIALGPRARLCVMLTSPDIFGSHHLGKCMERVNRSLSVHD